MTVLEFIRRELSNNEITGSTRFDDLGLDSLDFLDLMQQVEVEFKVKITDADIVSMEDVADLENVVSN